MKETTHFFALVSTAVCAGRSGGTGNAVDFLFVLGWTNSCPEGLLRVGVLGLVSKATFFFFLHRETTHFLALVPVAWLFCLFCGVEVLVWTGGTEGTGNAVASLSALSCTKTCPEDLFFSWSSNGTTTQPVE
jgi:hypothetical protein